MKIERPMIIDISSNVYKVYFDKVVTTESLDKKCIFSEFSWQAEEFLSQKSNLRWLKPSIIKHKPDIVFVLTNYAGGPFGGTWFDKGFLGSIRYTRLPNYKGMFFLSSLAGIVLSQLKPNDIFVVAKEGEDRIYFSIHIFGGVFEPKIVPKNTVDIQKSLEEYRAIIKKTRFAEPLKLVVWSLNSDFFSQVKLDKVDISYVSENIVYDSIPYVFDTQKAETATTITTIDDFNSYYDLYKQLNRLDALVKLLKSINQPNGFSDEDWKKLPNVLSKEHKKLCKYPWIFSGFGLNWFTLWLYRKFTGKPDYQPLQ